MPGKKYESKEERKFWNWKQNRIIFNGLVEGKRIDKIVEENKLQDTTVSRTLSNVYFNKRLKSFLSARLFDIQVQKVIDIPTIYEDLKKEFKKRLALASDDTIVKEYLKFLGLRIEQKLVNPELINIIFASIIGKTEETDLSARRAEDLQKDFGYKPLISIPKSDQTNEIKSQDSGVGEGKKDQNTEGGAN